MDDLVKQLMHATVSVDGDFDMGCNVRDAAVERLERGEWQPIETAPVGKPVCIPIILANIEKGWVAVGWGRWQGDIPIPLWDAVDDSGFGRCKPSHWMPLPAAPTNV